MLLTPSLRYEVLQVEFVLFSLCHCSLFLSQQLSPKYTLLYYYSLALGVQVIMNLSYLLLILPFVTAASSLAEERGDNLVVDLLDAAGEGPLVLADLDAQPAYCRGTPNFNCYR